MHKLSPLLLGALALTACAPTTKAQMDPFVGQTDMQLLAAWGAPDRETTSGGEGRHLTWTPRTRDGTVICQRTFTVVDHRVEGWSSSCAR